MKLLVIEDDNSIIDSIVLICKVGWPETEIVSTNLGEEGIDMVGSESPDVVVLDYGLPDISGLNVLKRIRLFSDVPIIILTVKEEEETIVRAFEYGVDEYLVKPFRQMELLARLKAIVRKRYSQPEEVDQKLGAFYFNFSTSSIVYNQRKINLTRNEMLILYHLARMAVPPITKTYSTWQRRIGI
jgi:DNA-binding response OmpR family regulator